MPSDSVCIGLMFAEVRGALLYDTGMIAAHVSPDTAWCCGMRKKREEQAAP